MSLLPLTYAKITGPIVLLFCAILFPKIAASGDCVKAEEYNQQAMKNYLADPLFPAENVLRDALKLCDKSSAIRYNLALVLIKRHKFDDAEILLKNIIERDSHYAPALNALALINFEEFQNEDSAIEFATKAVSIEPANVQYLSTLERVSRPQMPPILSIEDIVVKGDVLEALKGIELEIVLKNVGSADASKAFIELKSNIAQVDFPSKIPLEKISKSGGTQKVVIPIKGKLNLPTARADIDILVHEPLFKQTIRGKRISIPTQEFRKPQLILAKFSVTESQAANPNYAIDINEVVDVTFAVQNVGAGIAENISIDVVNNQAGVTPLSIILGDKNYTPKQKPHIEKLGVGQYDIATYKYFINSELIDKELIFSVQVSEKMNQYGIKQIKKVAINTTLKEEGSIRIVKMMDHSLGGIIIEDIPDLSVDIETNIPITNKTNDNAIAVVIGNRDYKRTKRVDYAISDARLVKKYLIDVMGYKEGNIIFMPNATKAELETIFGNTRSHEGKLFEYVHPRLSDVFIYYSGHGTPGLKDKKRYLAPIDAEPTAIEMSGYPLGVKPILS